MLTSFGARRKTSRASLISAIDENGEVLGTIGEIRVRETVFTGGSRRRQRDGVRLKERWRDARLDSEVDILRDVAVAGDSLQGIELGDTDSDDVTRFIKDGCRPRSGCRKNWRQIGWLSLLERHHPLSKRPIRRRAEDGIFWIGRAQDLHTDVSLAA